MKNMKKFDFRRQLQGMDMDGLMKLREYHLDWMLNFLSCGRDKDASQHGRYLGYIEDKINKLKAN